jgi:hypothetical protein
MTDADPIIRRLQRDALIWCAAAAATAVVGWPGRPEIAAGIVAGGLLAGVSFLAIKSSIDALLGLMGPGTKDPGPTPIERRRVATGALVKLAGRYALLAVLAYVMIVRLRLHPIGLIVGASSLVVSASIEAGRWVLRTL